MKERKNLYLGISGWAILLASAMSFTSCADDDIIDSSQLTTGKGICFNIANDNEAWQPDSRTSKAESTTTFHSENPDDGFSITATTTNGIRSFVNTKPQSRGTQTKEPGNDWSYKVGAYYYANANATPIDFFTENATGGLTFGSEGTGTSTYYWPKNGNISFFAVAPANIQGFNVPTAENIAAPSFTYTIDSDVTKHQDIMVAQTAAINTPTAPVGLQFQHLLAAVQFKVGKMQFIKINSITVSGVIGGTITMTYDETNDVWSYAGTDEDATYSPTAMEVPALAPEGTEITGNENNSMLLVMPQVPGENAKITINYTQILTGKTSNGVASIAAKVVDGVTSGAWEAGKTTVYSLNIGTTFEVEIPEPSNQDAHYIMLNMPYQLKAYSDYIQSVTATATWIEDESESGKNGISLKDSLELTYTQHRGYWTDQNWELIYSVDEDGKIYDEDGNESKDSEGNPKIPEPVLVDENTRGGNELPLNGLTGTIMLFIEENNGVLPRVGKLTLTATFKDNNIAPMIIGEQEFTQFCPSWNEANSIGVERIEDGETHPYGFNYDRTVTYTNNSGLLLRLISGWVATWYVNESDLIKFYYEDSWIPGVKYLDRIVLEYSSLNNVEDVAGETDGLSNTNALYEFTGGQSFKDTENSMNDIWGFSNGVPNESELPEDYAAYVALSCNRMRQLYKKVTPIGKGEPTETTTAILHEKNGENVIEWYLPSTTEAAVLVETSTGGDNQPTPLNGEYWSSNAGSDEDLKASSYTYKNNSYVNIKTTDRMTNLKVRAVRKKP